MIKGAISITFMYFFIEKILKFHPSSMPILLSEGFYCVDLSPTSSVPNKGLHFPFFICPTWRITLPFWAIPLDQITPTFGRDKYGSHLSNFYGKHLFSTHLLISVPSQSVTLFSGTAGVLYKFINYHNGENNFILSLLVRF